MSSNKAIKRKDKALARAVAAKIVKDVRKESGPSGKAAKRRTRRRARNNNADGQLTAAPTAMSRAMRFHPSRPQRTVVKAREEVKTIDSQAALTAINFRINPANPNLFPYLSVQAKQWEFYRFRKLKFVYVTRCATSKSGIVVLSPDYDNRDPDATDEKELMNTQDSIQDSLWKDIECQLDPKMMYSQGPRKKVSDTLMYDRDLYDSGIMRVATAGDIVTGCGALFVEYECEFEVPSQPETNTFGKTFEGVFATNDNVVQNLVSGTPSGIVYSVNTMFGDSVGLEFAATGWTATAKSKWLVSCDVTVAGTTAAAAFVATLSIRCNGGQYSDIIQKVSPPVDTGAHYHCLTTSGIVELDIGDFVYAEVMVTAGATPTVQTSSISLIPY
jgi:hypothetical protein